MKILALAVTSLVISAPALAEHYSNRPYTHAERLLIAKAEKAVRAQLKDPYSAIFEGATTYQNSAAVCGLFNAKNSYGGYVGDTLFLYVVATHQVVIGQLNGEDNADDRRTITMINRYCTNG